LYYLDHSRDRFLHDRCMTRKKHAMQWSFNLPGTTLVFFKFFLTLEVIPVQEVRDYFIGHSSSCTNLPATKIFLYFLS
jgi:hypothetical protein